MVMSFLLHRYGSTQANGVIHGEKQMSIGNERMSKMASLHLPVHIPTLYLVSEDERTKFLILSAI